MNLIIDDMRNSKIKQKQAKRQNIIDMPNSVIFVKMGICGATDENWKVYHEWYSSDKYKAKVVEKNKLKCATYNKYFGEYGLTKTLADYE